MMNRKLFHRMGTGAALAALALAFGCYRRPSAPSGEAPASTAQQPAQRGGNLGPGDPAPEAITADCLKTATPDALLKEHGRDVPRSAKMDLYGTCAAVARKDLTLCDQLPTTGQSGAEPEVKRCRGNASSYLLLGLIGKDASRTDLEAAAAAFARGSYTGPQVLETALSIRASGKLPEKPEQVRRSPDFVALLGADACKALETSTGAVHGDCLNKAALIAAAKASDPTRCQAADVNCQAFLQGDAACADAGKLIVQQYCTALPAVLAAARHKP